MVFRVRALWILPRNNHVRDGLWISGDHRNDAHFEQYNTVVNLYVMADGAMHPPMRHLAFSRAVPYPAACTPFELFRELFHELNRCHVAIRVRALLTAGEGRCNLLGISVMPLAVSLSLVHVHDAATVARRWCVAWWGPCHTNALQMLARRCRLLLRAATFRQEANGAMLCLQQNSRLHAIS